MKKWLILLLGLFVLGGCGKSSQPLSEKQAAKLFVESVIYNQSQKSFEENFVDGSAIVKEMEHSKDGGILQSFGGTNESGCGDV